MDSSEPSIQIAHELYPAGDFRVANATTLVDQLGLESFDVVVVRHILEHLPDFALAMDRAITVSRRLAVFVFYLSPHSLPLGVPKLDSGYGRPLFYTNIYSRLAINRFLEKRRLQWQWHDNLGTNRAGWFANEVNCALIVSRNPLQL